jgi:predicted permease
MFANAGNYGLPLVFFAFGQEALTRATVYLVIHVILLYSVGIVLMSSGGEGGLRAALRNVARVPHVYAIAAAGVVMLTGAMVPEPLMRAVGLLNNAALPMMVLLMGMQLERTAFPERPALVGLATAVRLLVLPLLALGLAYVFGLTGADRQAAVIQASMPAAVMITVLAGEFQAAPAFVTAVVFLSTVLSPLTLTPLLALLQQ